MQPGVPLQGNLDGSRSSLGTSNIFENIYHPQALEKKKQKKRNKIIIKNRKGFIWEGRIRL
jgi:hypothetical protein